MINVTKTYLPDYNEFISIIESLWHNNILTNNGPLVTRLTDELKRRLSLEHIELVANGTLAIQLAIRALGLKGEIITTPYSYVATTNAIMWEGCTPVFTDIDPQTFCLDPRLIEEAITDKTTAILPTHVYGNSCDVKRIQVIADSFNLKVIYDASHTFGVRLNGESLLRHGDCSTLSFHATKLFHTAEGGAVVCSNEEVKQKIFLASKFGHLGEDEYFDIGINAKMSELHAAMGLVVLPLVPQLIAARQERAAWYDELLDGLPLQKLMLPSDLEYNYSYYPIVFTSHLAMKNVQSLLQANEIFPRRYFYPSLNTLPFLPQKLRRPCPVSESLAQRVLTLPLYHSLLREDVEKIAAYIKEGLAN